MLCLAVFCFIYCVGRYDLGMLLCSVLLCCSMALLPLLRPSIGEAKDSPSNQRSSLRDLGKPGSLHKDSSLKKMGRTEDEGEKIGTLQHIAAQVTNAC